MSMIQNIGKLFYKDYYKDINFGYVLDRTQEGSQDSKIARMNSKIKSSSLVRIANPMADHHFQERIAYPGLVTGTGITHDSKKLAGGYNLGMHFDYTFGMPNVYGSSVKGVLRDYFKQARVKTVQSNGTETISYDDDLLVPIIQRGINIDELFEDIFNGKILKEGVDGKSIYVNKSIYNRDVFYDAVIVKAYKDKKGIEHIVDDDSITPHKDGPLKDPVPITMLKIAPGCIIEFRFHLNDFTSHKGQIFKAEEKLKLFKNILEIVGIGAKTNVGYGQLEEAPKDK